MYDNTDSDDSIYSEAVATLANLAKEKAEMEKAELENMAKVNTTKQQCLNLSGRAIFLFLMQVSIGITVAVILKNAVSSKSQSSTTLTTVRHPLGQETASIYHNAQKDAAKLPNDKGDSGNSTAPTAASTTASIQPFTKDEAAKLANDKNDAEPTVNGRTLKQSLLEIACPKTAKHAVILLL